MNIVEIELPELAFFLLLHESEEKKILQTQKIYQTKHILLLILSPFVDGPLFPLFASFSKRNTHSIVYQSMYAHKCSIIHLLIAFFCLYFVRRDTHSERCFSSVFAWCGKRTSLLSIVSILCDFRFQRLLLAVLSSHFSIRCHGFALPPQLFAFPRVRFLSLCSTACWLAFYIASPASLLDPRSSSLSRPFGVQLLRSLFLCIFTFHHSLFLFH